MAANLAHIRSNTKTLDIKKKEWDQFIATHELHRQCLPCAAEGQADDAFLPSILPSILPSNLVTDLLGG